MHIGIDATHMSSSGKGVSRFERCFIDSLATISTPHRFSVFVNRDYRLYNLPKSGQIQYVSVSLNNALLWEQVQLPFLMMKIRADCSLTLNDRLPLLGRNVMVMYLFEIPDHRIATNWRSAGRYQRTSDRVTRAVFPLSVRHAKHIIVSSKATACDLVSRYSVQENKISTVYPAAADEFVPELNETCKQRIRDRVAAPDGYVLHFSSANDPRDNTPVALRAFYQSIKKLDHPKKLIVAGNANLEYQGLKELIIELGLTDRLILPGFVTGRNLVELYQAADVYIDPSLYEGFGFQVLEAMTCGVPVICSYVTSLPEVAGDAAILLPPTDDMAYGEALTEVLSDPEKVATMRHAGLHRAKQFSWNKTVTQIIEICEKVVV